MKRAMARVFFFPGETVCNLLGAKADDDRMMIRTLVDMLAWNLVVVLAVVAIW